MTLYDLIRRFEGLSLKPYLCPAGVPTIGYGTTVYPNGVKVTLQDTPITKEVAEVLMKHDANIFRNAVAKVSPILLRYPNKHAAIASFAYNLGIGNYKASTLRRKVDAQDWVGATSQFGRWVFAGGKKLKGLIIRRQVEATLFNTEETT